MKDSVECFVLSGVAGHLVSRMCYLPSFCKMPSRPVAHHATLVCCGFSLQLTWLIPDSQGCKGFDSLQRRQTGEAPATNEQQAAGVSGSAQYWHICSWALSCSGAKDCTGQTSVATSERGLVRGVCMADRQGSQALSQRGGRCCFVTIGRQALCRRRITDRHWRPLRTQATCQNGPRDPF